MKNHKIIYTLFIAVLSLLMLSCGADDNEIKWGNTKVYMPQAAILNGGLSNDYLVPLDNNPSTQNYTIDETTNTLKIVLGVYRSGLQKLESFSVNVNANIAATTAVLPDIPRSVVLPSDTYTLPTSVTVSDGDREAIFHLEIDLNKLLTSYSHLALNKMVLVVEINNPTKYELNEELSKTTVIIDGASFLPAPKIVPGGDFETDGYWVAMNLVGSLPESAATIANGVLTFDYGDTSPVEGEILYYHPVELQMGQNYVFSCDFNSSGGANVTNCRFYVTLSKNLPAEGEGYNHEEATTFYSITDAWNGLKNPINGKLPQEGGWQDGINNSTGVFTSNFEGTGYIIIGVASWGSPIGKIIIDNVKIEAQ